MDSLFVPLGAEDAMAARLDSVARHICENSGWSVTNLELQKIIYMAQMMYMGRNSGERLVDATFEAWDYGPVAPELYHKIKQFGASPVHDVFYDARRFAEGSTRKMILDQVCSELIGKRPAELVNITHWPKGAWAKYYVPGARHVAIPDRDITQEYFDRLNAT